MESSIRDTPKKRGRKSTGGRQAGVMVRLPANQLAALDAWIANQPKPTTRPEAIRSFLATGLTLYIQGGGQKNGD